MAGWGAGFVGGLSEAVDAARQRKIEAQERTTRHAREAIATIVGSGQMGDVADLDPLLQVAYPDIYGEAAKKKGKKTGGVAPHDLVNAFLTHGATQDRGTQPTGAGGGLGTIAQQAPSTPALDQAQTQPQGATIGPTGHAHLDGLPDQFKAQPLAQGQTEAGNINLYNQPEVKNPDGTTSTVDSVGVNLEGKEMLLPTVTPEGEHFANNYPALSGEALKNAVADRAVEEYRKTGRHLGAFETPDASTAYAEQLHNDYAAGKYRKQPTAEPAVQRGAAPQAGAPPAVQQGAPPALIPAAQPPPAPGPRRSLFGVPLMTVEEAQQRDIRRKVGGQEAMLQSQMDLARRLYPAMKALDPSITLPMVLQEVTGHRMAGQGGANPYTTVFGTVNGTRVTALLNKGNGSIVDPVTHAPIEGFVQDKGPGAGGGKLGLTGAAAQAVQQELINAGVTPDQASPDQIKDAIGRASARLSKDRNLSVEGKEALLSLNNYKLGNEPAAGTEPTAAASPTAAAGAGAAPGAEPTAQPSTAAAPSAAPAPSPAKKYGPNYAAIGPDMQAQAERIANYDEIVSLPRGGTMTPRMEKILKAVKEINPDWQQTDYPAITAAKRGFTTGKQGEELKSYNTVLGHLNTFAQKAENLENGDIQLWNLVANKALAHTGDPRVDGMLTAADAVSDELTKLFRGTGGTGQEVQAWRKRLDDAKSPAQFGETIQTLNDLIASRQKALKSQWETVPGVPAWDKMPFVPQETKDTIAKTDVLARRLKGLKPAGAAGAKPGTTPQNTPGKATDTVKGTVVKPDGSIWANGVMIAPPAK